MLPPCRPGTPSPVDASRGCGPSSAAPGGLFALYVLLYSIGRFWIETLRIDPSHEIAGVRLNVWVAGLAIVLSAAFFAWWQRTWKRGTGPPPKVEAMAIPRER